LPVLRVQGRAVLGSIEVSTRLPDSRMPRRPKLTEKGSPRLGPRRG
jgi:hypothetical protein